MTRLQSEILRLYLTPDQEGIAAGPGGRVRAMVLELAGPTSWAALSKVWQGVQADLDLPAPAIAVSGMHGHQLWFSLREPVPVAQATAFLAALRTRYLGGVARERIAIAQPARVPPVEAAPRHWAAFLAPDLASLFDDEPWLDLPPSDDAQANLLSQLQSMKPEDFRRASERLLPLAEARTGDTSVAEGLEPRRFLLQVMNDSSVELHLRIAAAKALLPYFEGEHRP
ncbi:MAG: hypothetical protein JWQ76_686 [Ramlibacter sp.]|nr:hypothetical protein [Ramlibacter sp.]